MKKKKKKVLKQMALYSLINWNTRLIQTDKHECCCWVQSKTQNGFQASKNLTVGYGVHVANSCRQTENSQDAAVWNAVCLSVCLSVSPFVKKQRGCRQVSSKTNLRTQNHSWLQTPVVNNRWRDIKPLTAMRFFRSLTIPITGLS
jgi:hypothetical protein